MDHATLATLRDRHPAWRLLASMHAPLVASFLHRVFVAPNVRAMSEPDLAEALEDELFSLREQLGPEAYPKGAPEYLNDWAAPDKGWLRKFYKPGTDEAQFELTPATEKAIAWLLSLTERPFVGTESPWASAMPSATPTKAAAFAPSGTSSCPEELSERLDRVLALPVVAALEPDPRTRRVHHDWLEAGEHAQRTLAQLSQQLRRFLDDRAFLENRRILDLLRGIEGKALGLRDATPSGTAMHIDAMAADIELPLERPLFTPSLKPRLADLAILAGEDDIDTARLFDQIVVDKARLRSAVQRALRRQSQITLRELLDVEPLRQGLAELVAYLELAHARDGSDTLDGLRALVDEAVIESIRWQASNAAGEAVTREARVPRVIFTR